MVKPKKHLKSMLSVLRQAGDAFVLVQPRSFTNVCFWWIPPDLQPFRFAQASAEQLQRLSQVCIFTYL